MTKKNKLGEYTFFLFAEPSFTEGMSRVLDFGSTLQAYNVSFTTLEADYRAIYNDWKAVGRDIKDAIELYQWQTSLK